MGLWGACGPACLMHKAFEVLGPHNTCASPGYHLLMYPLSARTQALTEVRGTRMLTATAEKAITDALVDLNKARWEGVSV